MNNDIGKQNKNRKVNKGISFLLGEVRSLVISARSSSPKEPPLKALTEPDVKLSLHPALIIQPNTHTRFQCAKSSLFLLLKALTLLAACINVLSFLYLRFAQRLSFLSKWNKTLVITLRPNFP